MVWNGGIGGLAGGHGFAGEGGVIHPQAEFLDDPRVCRNIIAFRQDQYISGDDLGIEARLLEIPAKVAERVA